MAWRRGWSVVAVVAWMCGALGACARAGTRDTVAHDARLERVRSVILAAADTLDVRLAAVAAVADTLGGDARALPAARRALVEARLAYKRVEGAMESLAPTVARGLNGPPILEIEEDEGDRPERSPEGLQVVEELLYGGAPQAAAAEVANEARIGRSYVQRFRQVVASARLTPDLVGDIVRAELALLASHGLGGFDAPEPARNLTELAAALEGLREVIIAFEGTTDGTVEGSGVVQRLDSAVAVALAEAGSALPDRWRLLVTGLRPAALAARAWTDARGMSVVPGDTLWRRAAATPFEVGAWDAWAVAPPDARPEPAREALGHDLFFDTRLSGDGTRSCATCHLPERAFSDGRRVAALRPGIESERPARNTPTLVNAALQPTQLHDSRLVYLEDQVADVVHDAAEMGGDLATAAERLSRDARVAAAFGSAFGGGDSALVTPRRIQLALAAYVRSLTTMDAPFDRAVRGDARAMTPDAIEGFNVFMGKARCGSCHFAPLFSGTVPPRFSRGEVEVIGVPAAWPDVRAVDPDIGRERVAQNPLHRHGFRTLSIRNAALTAPYMHNGVFRTLEEVVAFYNGGGGVGHGLDLPHQTLPADSLHLAPAETRALVRFMEALTDTTGTTARPTPVRSMAATTVRRSEAGRP